MTGKGRKSEKTNGIVQQNNRIFFYGNPAGFVKEKSAVIDKLFICDELSDYVSHMGLDVHYEEGVFERLTKGGTVTEDIVAPALRSCRIWQLKPEVDIDKKFVSFEKLQSRFGGFCMEDYEIVFDGQTGTSDLEQIYEKFNENLPEGFHGHSLSISDIVELYDKDKGELYYVDRIGYVRLDEEAPCMEQGMQMQ